MFRVIKEMIMLPCAVKNWVQKKAISIPPEFWGVGRTQRIAMVPAIGGTVQSLLNSQMDKRGIPDSQRETYHHNIASLVELSAEPGRAYHDQNRDASLSDV